MPVLKKLPEANIQKFYLPSTASLPEAEQAWVEMDISMMSMRDMVEMDSLSGEETDMKRGFSLIAKRVHQWNFTEEDNVTPVPITAESVMRLDFADLSFLFERIPQPEGTSLTVVQKKS